LGLALEKNVGVVGIKTKVEAFQKHPKDQKIRIGFNNIEIFTLKFQKYV
jgi:hypothetical protein